MIYLDTSVALAQLLAEDRRPPDALWREPLVSSRLIQYEIWNRLHARGLGDTHGEAAELLLARVAMIELRAEVLERALEPFPMPVRTLDGLHLASLDFLRARGVPTALASYDARFCAAASAMGFELRSLD